MLLDLSELRKALAFIAEVNSVPLVDIEYVDSKSPTGSLQKVPASEVEDWKFIGLSNVYYFAENNLI
jgi:hypothetical protein